MCWGEKDGSVIVWLCGCLSIGIMGIMFLPRTFSHQIAVYHPDVFLAHHPKKGKTPPPACFETAISHHIIMSSSYWELPLCPLDPSSSPFP